MDEAATASGLSFFLQVVRLHYALIVGATLATLVAGLLYLKYATPIYVGTSTVLIDYKRLAPLNEDLTSGNGKIDASAVQSQVNLITSQNVLKTVATSEKLDSDPEFVGDVSGWRRPLAWVGLLTDPATLAPEARLQVAVDTLTRRLTVDRKDVSYVIGIDASSRDAQKAARLANAVADSYIADQLSAKTDALRRATEWLQERIQNLQNDVNAAQRASVDYRMANSIMMAAGKFMDETQVSDLSTRLMQARQDRSNANAKLERIEAIIKSGKLDGGVVDEFSNSVIVNLRNTYLKNIRQAEEFAARYGKDHLSVLRLQTEAANIQNNIFDEFKRIAQGYRSDAEVATNREKTLSDELAVLGKQSNEAQAARVVSSQLDAVASSMATIRDTFVSRNTEALQKESFPITEARVIGRADTPLRPASPTAFKALFGGSLLGLGFGFFLAVCRETFSHRIRSRQQLELVSGAPCLGLLPKIDIPKIGRVAGRGARPELSYVTKAPFSLFAETIRSIRVAVDIEYRGAGGGEVIGVVSSHPHEGKSLVAANLAYSWASSGAPTLLIDGDLRRHTLSSELAPNIKTGLGHLLYNQGRISEILQSLVKGNLHFIPAGGARVPDATNLMLSPAMASLLDGARKSYRYVVIDLPPLLPVADARAIAPLIDHFLLVTEWNFTSVRALTDAVATNTNVSNKLVGSVLNKVDLQVMERLNETSLSRAYSYYDETISPA